MISSTESFFQRVILELWVAQVRDLEGIMGVVRSAACALVGADGSTFVLRDGDQCFYTGEDAISLLWKGLRFPMSMCISGWIMMNHQIFSSKPRFWPLLMSLKI